MRRSRLHEYRGITLDQSVSGAWVIQIKLLGTYRKIKTFADSAREAAWRHDIALSRLEDYLDGPAKPNFPERANEICFDPTGQPSDMKDFLEELRRLFNLLAQECWAAGKDPVEVGSARRAMALAKAQVANQAAFSRRLAAYSKLLRIQNELDRLDLPTDVAREAAQGLEKLIAILHKQTLTT